MRVWVPAPLARRRANANVGLHTAKSEMSTKGNRCLQARRQHHGAELAAIIRVRASCTVVSQLRSPSQPASLRVAVSKLGQVASFRAQLRSSSSEFRSCRFPVASSLAVQRSGAVRLVSASRASSFTFLRSTSLPNNALVPTANRHAPVGSRSQSAAPAAQRGRSA